MTMFGIDTAWYKPSISLLKQHRVNFVVGYLSHDSAKNLNKSYVNSIRKNKMGVSVVWETTANRASGSYNDGRLDAHDAVHQAAALGYPTTLPIYFAVDWDANPSDVHSYFSGVRSVVGARAGVYAGYRVVADLFNHHGIKWTWQTLAWSGGRWFSHNTLEQHSIEQSWGPDTVDYDIAPSRPTWEAHGLWRPVS